MWISCSSCFFCFMLEATDRSRSLFMWFLVLCNFSARVTLFVFLIGLWFSFVDQCLFGQAATGEEQLN